MALQVPLLRDTRFVERGSFVERRYVPRPEIEQQLREYFGRQHVELPDDVWADFSDEQLYYRWLDCLQGRGWSTVYGALPNDFLSLLERLGYDPREETGLPAWLFERWQLVPNPPD
ncbi:MAG: hypothetical protein HY421_02500 [Candidatus Kerfeldbacteria bacterium]|nr:hypothetical protein [Candidatus Kerfeldbacteria bacterium]